MQKPQKSNFFAHRFAVVNVDGSRGTSWRGEYSENTIAEIIAKRTAQNGKAIASVEYVGYELDVERYNDSVSVYETRIEEDHLDAVRSRRVWATGGSYRRW